MPLNLDTATVYQIFYGWYQGHTQTQIAATAGTMRDTVAAHLALKHWHHYPPELRARLRKILTPRRPATLPVPPGWITLTDASYFFLERCSAKTLRECHRSLRTEMHAGQRLTRREWVLDYVTRKRPTTAEGIHLTPTAALMFDVQPPSKHAIVRVAELATLPPFDAETIHRAIAIMDYTGLPYLTLAPDDFFAQKPR